MSDEDVGSYEKVNYLLRLRKQIERKMIIEMLQKIKKELPIEDYSYIGLGSIYFADFILFHKYLHINDMTSLEKDRKKKKRFKFNKPYDFIKLKMKVASTYLKELEWEKDPLFIWLDYDYFIDMDTIEDIIYISNKAKPNDIFIVTIDAEFPEDPDAMQQFLDDYRLYIGSDITVEKAKRNFPKVLHRMVNTSLKEGEKYRSSNIKISQLLNLSYKDTSKMYTYGCIFEDHNSSIIEKCNLKQLGFIRTGKTVFKIDCPLITPKEKFHLDSCIKENKKCIDPENQAGLKKAYYEKYGIFYKYYPQYFESIY